MATQIGARSPVLLLVYCGSVKAVQKDQRVQKQDFQAICYLRLHACIN